MFKFSFFQKKKITTFSILLLLFFLQPSFVHAAPAPGQPTGPCKSGALTIACPGEADCWDIKNFKSATYKILSSPADNMCLPRLAYPNCSKFDDGVCENSGGTDQCVVVSSVKNPSLFGMACLSKNLVPQEKTSVDMDCSTCGIYQQCVFVLVNNTDVWPRKRCIYKDALPPSVIDEDGTCQTNAACTADETCILNSYEPQKLGFSCVKNSAISESAKCPVAGKNELASVKVGISCSESGTDSLCMYAIKGYKGPKNFKFGYRCVDTTKIAGGKFSPSVEVCKNDADCAIKNPQNPFCILSPVTKKNQCFNQAAIFNDMKSILTDPKKCVPGAQSCECPHAEIPNCAGENSICTTYIGDGTKTTLVCINNTNLGTGGATVTANIKPDVAAQTYKAYAPKLQVDIPGLTFDGSITAEDSANGLKKFSIPYLATYIQAVYKYALGLGVLIAVVIIMFAGFRWMTSFGNAKSIGGARDMIGNAVFGLALLFGVFTILYVINPDLPKLQAINILAPKQEVFIEKDFGGDDENAAKNGGPAAGGALPADYKPSGDVYCPKSGGRDAISKIVSSLQGKVVYRWGGKIQSQNIKYSIGSDANKALIAENPSYKDILTSCPSGFMCFDCSGLASYIMGCAGINAFGGSAEITGSPLKNTRANPIDYENAIVDGYKLQPGDIFGWQTSDSKIYLPLGDSDKEIQGHVLVFVGDLNGKHNQIVQSTGRWKGQNGYLPGLNAMVMDFSKANMTKGMPGSSKTGRWWYRVRNVQP